MQQSTIARRVRCDGIGLHDGEPVSLTLAPGAPGTGRVFVVPGASPGVDPVEIPARPDALAPSSRATVLVSGRAGDRVSVGTVEHLLATLVAFGIDNVRIELGGREVPAMDGSAAPFVELLERAGRRAQAASRRILRLEAPIEIRDGERSIRVEPAPRFSVRYGIDFPHPCIGRQVFELDRLDAERFARELAPARTFGFVSELEGLGRAGLARGGSLENAIVLDETRVLNAGPLRWADEFVRHKVLDLIGDLALLGAVLEARVEVERGGHALHHRLVHALAGSMSSEAGHAVDATGSLGRLA
ncbi:MAG: UDP-3-O-acyl-N-acetylglucosamine deacetylase [Myxococcota bacterium]